MITLAQARVLLPPEEQGISDTDLSGLLAGLYSFADLVIDMYLEKKGGTHR